MCYCTIRVSKISNAGSAIERFYYIYSGCVSSIGIFVWDFLFIHSTLYTIPVSYIFPFCRLSLPLYPSHTLFDPNSNHSGLNNNHTQRWDVCCFPNRRTVVSFRPLAIRHGTHAKLRLCSPIQPPPVVSCTAPSITRGTSRCPIASVSRRRRRRCRLPIQHPTYYTPRP